MLNQQDKHLQLNLLVNLHQKSELDKLSQGEVGYLVANVKDLKSVPVGDTLISAKYPDTAT